MSRVAESVDQTVAQDPADRVQEAGRHSDVLNAVRCTRGAARRTRRGANAMGQVKLPDSGTPVASAHLPPIDDESGEAAAK